jgi:hypothetical protein
VEAALASSPFAAKDPLAKNVSFFVDQNLGEANSLVPFDNNYIFFYYERHTIIVQRCHCSFKF